MTERHVIPQDLDLPAFILNLRRRIVGEARLDGVVQLDVGQLPSADDALLLFGRQRVPSG